MEKIKVAAVAGHFYPLNPEQCRLQVQDCLSRGVNAHTCPLAVIAPHAGYIYSGKIAGSAYKVLQDKGSHIRKIVILGPAHRVPVAGCVLSSYDYFNTPLGNVKLDRKSIELLATKHKLNFYDQAFEHEHCIEVQLPFLQTVLSHFEIIPILVGQCEPEIISNLLKDLWNRDDTLVVVSSDLSHYLSYQHAWAMDLKTTESIELCHGNKLGDNAACGRYPVKGLLHFIRDMDLNIRPIDLCNSGDTSANKDRVVGYGAYHVYNENEEEGLYNRQQKATLIQLARQSITYGVKNKALGSINLEKLPFKSTNKRATFVTLEKNGHLRGCIGSLQAHCDIATDVFQNAFRAAFQDRRFPPVTEDEIPNIKIHISVLSAPVKIPFRSEPELISQLRPGIDGLIIQDQGKSAVFLPTVWSHFNDRQRFVNELKVKAGMNANHWSDSFVAFRFRSDLIHQE